MDPRCRSGDAETSAIEPRRPTFVIDAALVGVAFLCTPLDSGVKSRRVEPASNHSRSPRRQHAGTTPPAVASTRVDVLASRAAPLVSEERYKAAFRHDLTANFIAHPDGTLFDCNAVFVRAFRFASRKTALASNLRTLLARRTKWSTLVQQLRSRRALVRWPCDWVRCDGTVLHMIQTVVGRFDEGGQLTEVLGFLFDDTERTQTAVELDHYRGQLETLVKKQTADLQASFEQLRLADQMASIGTLAAGLGHDMNNVLLPVRAQLNVLREGSRDLYAASAAAPSRANGRTGASNVSRIDIRPAIDAIASSVAYLQQLADGLHALTQNPDNTHPDGPPTDLRDWWDRTGIVIAKGVPQHVKLTASIPPHVPPVSVAPHRLTQAVLNLVINAGEAIPRLDQDPSRKRRQGRVKIAARSESDAAGARWIALSVSDNGAGMTAEVKRRAFELFFTTKSRGRGTGLGLPLVHKVAARVGGRVEIDTALGKGTTVTMWLPEAHVPSEAQPRHHAVIAVSNARLASLVRHVLEAAGVQIIDASQDLDRASLWVADQPSSMTRQGGEGKPILERNGIRRLTIAPTDDFKAIRELVAKALASMSEPGGK